MSNLNEAIEAAKVIRDSAKSVYGYNALQIVIEAASKWRDHSDPEPGTLAYAEMVARRAGEIT